MNKILFTLGWGAGVASMFANGFELMGLQGATYLLLTGIFLIAHATYASIVDDKEEEASE